MLKNMFLWFIKNYYTCFTNFQKILPKINFESIKFCIFVKIYFLLRNTDLVNIIQILFFANKFVRIRFKDNKIVQ